MARKDDACFSVCGRTAQEAWEKLVLMLDASLGRRPFAFRVVPGLEAESAPAESRERRFSSMVVKSTEEAALGGGVDRASGEF